MTIGKEYEVITVYVNFSSMKSIKVRFVDNMLTPAIFPLECFEVVNSDIPEGWILSFYDDTSLSIGPKEFSQKGFWEAYFDSEEWALSLFDKVVNKGK